MNCWRYWPECGWTVDRQPGISLRGGGQYDKMTLFPANILHPAKDGEYLWRTGRKQDVNRIFLDPVMRWSDYAALRAVAGYPAAEQEPGRYLIHCTAYLEEPLRDYTRPLNPGGITLAPESVYTELFSGHWGYQWPVASSDCAG